MLYFEIYRWHKNLRILDKVSICPLARCSVIIKSTFYGCKVMRIKRKERNPGIRMEFPLMGRRTGKQGAVRAGREALPQQEMPGGRLL